MTTLADIQTECDSYGGHEPEYMQRMMHRVPDAAVMDKVRLLVDVCRDKVVLSLGCTGPYQEVVDRVCKKCYGIDKEPQEREHFVKWDLDAFAGDEWHIDRLDDNFKGAGIELVWCGEILEHLARPGDALAWLRQFDCPILITVPNAFWETGRQHMLRGVENVNIDHVAYYSYWTLKGLVERCGYEVQEFYWYKGKPLTAEGLIFVVR